MHLQQKSDLLPQVSYGKLLFPRRLPENKVLFPGSLPENTPILSLIQKLGITYFFILDKEGLLLFYNGGRIWQH